MARSTIGEMTEAEMVAFYAAEEAAEATKRPEGRWTADLKARQSAARRTVRAEAREAKRWTADAIDRVDVLIDGILLPIL